MKLLAIKGESLGDVVLYKYGLRRSAARYV